MNNCSTKEAAAKLGISLVTLQRRIANGSVKPPKLQKVGGVTVRLWSQKDIEQVRKQLKKK
jgi:predicted DNA-binding transcriptional regulator AlpA